MCAKLACCSSCSGPDGETQAATALRLEQIEAKVTQMELNLGLNHPQVLPGDVPSPSALELIQEQLP